jgi:2-dehydro-3-deoxyphosphogalactonate aldolase
MTLDEALGACPIIAILRGVTADEVAMTAEALFDAGVRAVEIPLNSPSPLDSLARLARAMNGRMACGAGTVLNLENVEAAVAAGARFIVAPNVNPGVIEKALALGAAPVPGFATATEAFTALAAGAQILKLFPASAYGPAYLRALKSVLPAQARVLAVGGVGPPEMAAWQTVGVVGFGLGSEIYRPGQSARETLNKAARAVAAAAAPAAR